MSAFEPTHWQCPLIFITLLNENFIELQHIKLFYEITNENIISHVPDFMFRFDKEVAIRNLLGISMRNHRR